MMSQIPVSLAEVLEVRSDSGLSDDEIIAVLQQGIEPLESLIQNAKASSVRNMGLSPDSVYFLPDGTVQLKPLPFEMLNENFLPPEYAQQHQTKQEIAAVLAIDLNKVYIYAFGAVLSYALEHGTQGSKPSSPEIYSLLNLMTVRDPSVRLSLPKIAQMTEKHIKADNINAVVVVKKLFRAIMGSEEDFANLSFDGIHPRKPSVDVGTGFSDEDLQTPTITNGGFYKKDFTTDERDFIDLTPTYTEIQPKMSELERHNNNDKSPNLNGKKPLSFVSFDRNRSPVDDRTRSPIDERIGSPVANSTTLLNDGLIEDLLDFKNDDIAVIDLKTVDNTGGIHSNSKEIVKENRSSWINFEETATSTAVERPTTLLKKKDIDFFSSSDENDDSVFNRMEKLRHTDNSVNQYNNLVESTSFSPPIISSVINDDKNNYFQKAFSSDHVDFDDDTVVFATDNDRKTLSGASKSRFIEKLMPTVPSEFTYPKDHGYLERTRIYHSVDCSFCSPTKRAVYYAEEKYRTSLPNLFYDLNNDERRFYTKKSYGAFNFRPSDAQNRASSSLKRRSSDSNGSSPIPDQKSHFIDDPVFGSFEKLSTTPNDQLSEQNLWYTVEIERPSSSSSVNSMTKSVISEKIKALEREDDWNLSEITTTNNDQSGSLFRSYDPEDDTFKFETKYLDVDILEPIDENLVEMNEDDTPPPSSPKVALYERREYPPNDSPPPSLYRQLSREGSMRVMKNGSIRSSNKRQKPPMTPDRKISTDSSSKIIPALGVQQVISQQQRNKLIGDSSTIENETSASTTTTTTNVANHPAHQKRRLSNVHQNIMPGKPVPLGKGPEFFYNSRQPSIRLKAPSAQRTKKLFRHPLEKSVLVVLLNGQRVDVACRTDCSAENIFEAISTHTNLNEWHFFGLSLLKDGEHFFLEPEQKLEKFAPPGWRQASRHVVHARVVFTLYLRLKYYPVALDFVKTEQTLHQIYLQLRRDVLEERLQCGKDTAYQLAALSLQAEYGDRPWDSAEYFVVDHYLPHRHLVDEIGGEVRIRTHLAELHGQYAGTNQRDAETEYVKMCQNLREYGIHFYRLYRTKPSQLLTPSPLGDPETGTSLWIGLMPRGVIIFEERSGERVPISQYPWHMTATLQFDHKRFVIFPLAENNDPNRPPPKVVFYTDDHKKSMYFVNFAAAQHKFCMKMRLWAATLPADGQLGSLDRRSLAPKVQINGRTENASNRSSATETDSGISREASPDGREVVFAKTRPQHRERAVDAVVMPRSTPVLSARGPMIPQPELAEISVPSRDISSILNPNETVSGSLAERFDNASSPLSPSSAADCETFVVTLVKDPHYGLGLTLVDGEIQGIKGVYVRSLTPGGPAELEGRLRLADKLISVNGQSLEDKSRHDAVDLVRQSSNEVVMGVLRIKSLYSSSESVAATSGTGTIADVNNSRETDRSSSLPRPSNANDENRPVPALRKSPNLPKSALSSREKNEKLDADLLTPMKFTSNSHMSGTELWMDDTSISGGVKFVDNRTEPKMYGGLHSDSETSSHTSDDEDALEQRKRPLPTSSRSVTSDDEVDDKAKRNGTDGLLKPERNGNLANNLIGFSKSSEKLNKDWTDQIALGETINWKKDDQSELILVVLEKNENGSLGIQVAGGKGQKKVYIKSLVAEPAISAHREGKILPGDQLASVNGTTTRGLSHQEVVNLLKTATSPVKVELLRPKALPQNSVLTPGSINGDLSINESKVETLDVLLEKPASGSLGLSLAKPPGGEGIFIRVIGPGSVAAVDGRLKVGDRLWMINGDSVARASPTEVVEKLKSAQGFVKLVVKRELKENNNNSYN